MTQQVLDNGETGLEIRTKINDNFSELYKGRYVNRNLGTTFESFFWDGFIENNSNDTSSIKQGDRWFQKHTSGLGIIRETSPAGIVTIRCAGQNLPQGFGQSQVNVNLGVDAGTIPGAGAILKFAARVAIRPAGYDVAPDATENYVVPIGFSTNLDVASGSGNVAAFLYRWNGSAVELIARTRRAAGTAVVTALTVPTAGQFYDYEVVITGDSTTQFYIDGVLVATHTTSTPNGAMADGVHIIKTATATSAQRAAQIDWMSFCRSIAR